MSTPVTNAAQDQVERDVLERLDAIAEATPVPSMRPPARGLIGRMLGRAPEIGGQQRSALAASRDVDVRAASRDVDVRAAHIVACRLAGAQRRDIAALLPEALVNTEMPADDEERFMHIAGTARRILRRHLERTLLGTSEDEIRSVRLQSVVDALEDNGSQTLSERLQRHFNARWERRRLALELDTALAAEDPILVEIDNVVLGDVREDGTMPYEMDVVVDGAPFARVASPGDGTVLATTWHGQHGPDDMAALRHHIARYGRRRSDAHGERHDSLEEMLLDRVTSLYARLLFQQEASGAVLFCVPDPAAPDGHVVGMADIGDDVSREDVWDAVMDRHPNAVLLDQLDPEEAFTLWLAYSSAPGAA